MIKDEIFKYASYVFYPFRMLTDKEKEVLDYTCNYLISLGADSDYFYLYILTQEVELIYKSWRCSIRYKLYKKKKGGRITYISESNSQNSDVFEAISEIKKYGETFEKNIQNANNDKFLYDMSGYIKYDSSLKI